MIISRNLFPVLILAANVNAAECRIHSHVTLMSVLSQGLSLGLRLHARVDGWLSAQWQN